MQALPFPSPGRYPLGIFLLGLVFGICVWVWPQMLLLVPVLALAPRGYKKFGFVFFGVGVLWGMGYFCFRPSAPQGVVSNLPVWVVQAEVPQKRFGTTSQRVKIKTHQGAVLSTRLRGPELFMPGDQLWVEGVVSSDGRARNPGGFPYGFFLWLQREQGYMRQAKVQRRVFGAWSLNRAAFDVRMRMYETLQRRFPARTADLLSALLLARREGIPEDLRDSMVQSGTVHLLAVSGLHIGVLLFAVLWIFRLLNFSRRVQALAVMGVSLFLGQVLQWTPSVTRAVCFAVIFQSAQLFGRPMSGVRVLALTAGAVVLVDPGDLFRVGFLLSCSAVLGLLFFPPLFFQLLPAPKETPGATGLGFRAQMYAYKGLVLGASAWLGVLPWSVYFFGSFAPMGLLANILLSPLGALAVVGGYVCALPWGLLDPVLAPLGVLLQGLLWALESVSGFLGRLPFAHFYFPGMPAVVMVLLAGGLAGVGLLAYVRRKKVGLVCLGIIFMCAWAWPQPLQPQAQALMLDVGKGSAMALLEENSSGCVLVDCGTDRFANIGRQTIAPALWTMGVTRVNALLITHADADHVNGVKGLLSRMPIDQAFVPQTTDPRMQTLAARLKAWGVKVSLIKAGDTLETKSWKFNVLAPTEPATGLDANNQSLVTRAVHKNGISYLLTGDLESKGMGRLLASPGLGPCDVVLLPHHGSEVWGLLELLQKTKPQAVLVSTRAGFMAKTTRDLLKRYAWWSTHEYGAVLLEHRSQELWIKPWLLKKVP